MNGLVPSHEGLAGFCSAMFKHANPNGIVSLRAFKDGGNGADKALFIDPINVGHPDFIGVVFERARQAAEWADPAVFCPPVMTFRDGKNAKVENILEGVALSVECDQAPSAALEILRPILGEPTIVSASGGEWSNPDTGEIERKLHLHWRLSEPTKTVAGHVGLREARDLATKLAGGDPSAVPLVHPLRWPGSWHRKATPRLSVIVAQSDNEIELNAALGSLREAMGANSFIEPGTASRPKKLQADSPRHIKLALKAIPNDEKLNWKEWNDIGLATWNASNGSELGREAFAQWSAKSPKDNPVETSSLLKNPLATMRTW